MKNNFSNQNNIFWALLIVLVLFLVGGVLLYMIGLLNLTDSFLPRDSKDETSLEERVIEQDASISNELSINPDPSPRPEIKILFGGDMMFDRNIRLAAQDQSYQYLLQPLAELFVQQDLVVANLEGPVTNNNPVSVGTVPGSPNNYIFTFSPQVVPVLKQYKIEVVNLGNNHILNFGLEGYRQTINYLNQEQVAYFGQIGQKVPQAEQQLSLIEDINGYRLAFVNYNQFAQIGLEPVLTEIDRIKKQADLVIVFSHWGNEYQPEANQVITNWAHQLIDQGADVVIGSHPHVVQNHEVYQGKHIYYSLGNFVFDQYFQPEVRRGLLVQLVVDSSTDQLEFNTFEIEMLKTGQTQLKN
jgi:poly-gamma-glutamate synthesis protein (capsule biosynthesis protein)